MSAPSPFLPPPSRPSKHLDSLGPRGLGFVVHKQALCDSQWEEGKSRRRWRGSTGVVHSPLHQQGSTWLQYRQTVKCIILNAVPWNSSSGGCPIATSIKVVFKKTAPEQAQTCMICSDSVLEQNSVNPLCLVLGWNRFNEFQPLLAKLKGGK